MTYINPTDPTEFDAQEAFYLILDERLDRIGVKTAERFAKEAGLHFDATDFDLD